MKFYPLRFLLFLLFFSAFTVSAWAQAISVTNFDPGPYSPGSTIAVPFHVDDAAGCIGQTNNFNLYLSNAAGVYSATPLATVSGFYATFINATIPTTTPAGTGYKVKVTSTSNPGATILESAPFTITTGGVVKASIISSQSIDNGIHPEIFGNCNNTLTNFTFTDNSTNATTINADFINESANAYEATVSLVSAGASGVYNPDNTNYTIIVRASNGITHSTKAYTLINNPKNSNFGFSGTQSVCLGSTLIFNIDIASPDGIQYNYPGNTYKFDWGDGSNTVLTFCQIEALNGHIGHQYVTSSCGNVVGTTPNVFKISFEPNNPYCGSFNAVSTTAKISAPPNNSISGPASACTGVSVQFSNTSYPGEDPNSTQGSCIDFAAARYTWYVDGVIQTGFSGVAKSKIFNPSLTAGTHIIKLSLDNNQTSCTVADATFTVCVQDKPVPSFTVPAAPVCLTGSNVTVPVTNTTVVDNSCFTNTYQWNVTGGTVTYAGGTSSTSINPQFVFSATGNYTINLRVTDACGNLISAPQKQIVVNGSPTPTFSGPAVANFCGPQVITFNNTVNSPTRITYTGTAPGATVTYLWNVVPQGGAAAATFANGTTAASQYPQIDFPDIGDYLVSVTYQNSCGIQSNSQFISIKQAPAVSAGTDETICPTLPSYTLAGTINDMSNVQPNGISWTKTINGVTNTTGLTNINTLTPTYTLSPGDAGKDIVFTLDVKTTLNQCSDITQSVTIHVTPTETVTSAATQAICSGNKPNYTITASNAGSTFTWTASGTANATGFTANGNGDLINDVLTTTNNNPATVTYTITPTSSNGCPGATFQYKVTVNPLPVVTLPASVSLCSGANVNSVINLAAASNLPGTKYTWTATASSPNITGFTNNNVANATISNVLVNSGITVETVSYIFTPISASGCPGAPSAPVVVSVQPAPTQAVADPAATENICDQSAFTLNANVPVIGTGKWTLVSSQTGVTFVDDTDPHTTANGLVAGQTYQFKWTITSCSLSTQSTVTVINSSPSNGGSITGPAQVCSGSSGDITLSGYTGNILYWETSLDGVSNWIQVANTTNTFHYTNLTVKTWFRAVVQSGNCSTATSLSLPVNVLAPVSNNTVNVNNTAASTIEICNGDTPAKLTGSTPLGGDGTFTYQWQQSTDGGHTYNAINAAIGQNYQPGPLTATTYFQRIVNSAACSGATSSVSNPIIVTVAPVINASFTALVKTSCAPFNINQNNNITVITDPNVTYDWSINDGNTIQHFTGVNFPSYTINNPGKNVSVTLTATNTQNNSCQKLTTIQFSTVAQIVPVLTLNGSASGCADPVTKKMTVTFKNMSTPSGGDFYWDFGDGSPVYRGSDLQLNHDFAIAPDGISDAGYTITLTPVDCNINNNSSTQTITVYPANPTPTISIDNPNGCAPYNLTVHNRTLGTNATYTYYLKDANGALVKPPVTKTNNDKTDVVFTNVDVQNNNFTSYSVSMVAINLCGNTGNSNNLNITLSPSNIVPALSVTPVNQATNTVVGCAPFEVTLHNHSVGGNLYIYNIYKDDVFQQAITTPLTTDQHYRFEEPGNYSISIVVVSDCTTGTESPKVKVTVNPLPEPAFTADATTACGKLTVNFTNNTPDATNAPAASYTYLWDFGDGTTSNLYTPPPHMYASSFGSPYTVTLTATNANGCSATSNKTNYIVINPSAGTDFRARPDTIINLPNYHFSFVDESTGNSVSWNWDFGDGSTSTERNPEHTYADTGKYVVSLTTTTAAGCSETKKHTAQITGVPGQLYVPNAFMPGSLNTELRVFTLKGSGIKRWDMRIYDSWGNLLFETTKLNGKGEPVEFWDGKYKGQDVQQGGYAWEISATFINGTDWRGMSYKGSVPKKSGVVTLIR